MTDELLIDFENRCIVARFKRMIVSSMVYVISQTEQEIDTVERLGTSTPIVETMKELLKEHRKLVHIIDDIPECPE